MVATVATQTPGGVMAPAPNAAPPPPREVALLGAPKQRDRSIVGPSLGPRDARGCFPCPAGCARTFAHAPAAVQHGKSCAAGGARPPGAAAPKRPAAAAEAAAPPPPPPAAPLETNRDDKTAEEAAALSSSNDDGAELTEAEVRGALQAAGGRMKTKDLLVRFKARLKANPANKEALKRILKAVVYVQDLGVFRVLVLKPPDTSRDDAAAAEAAAPPPPPPDTSRDEELARQLAGLPGRARQATQRFSSLQDAGQSYASPKRAAEESQRPKKKAKSPVAASVESSDAAKARALATDQAAIREAYAREQARATEEAREQARATEEQILRIGNAALTRRLSTEEEIPRGREKKRCAATRAPAETPSTAPRIEGIAAETTDDDSDAEVLPAKRVRGSAAATPLRPSVASLKKQLLCTTCKATYTSGHFCPTCETRLFVVDQPTPLETNRDDETAEEAALPSPAATTASDKPTVPVTPNIPKVKALASPVRPEYAETPTRKQITQQMCGESTASSSSNSDTDEDFSPDEAPVRNGAPVRSPPVESDTEDDARPPPNDDTDDDLPLPPPVVKEEPDDDGEREFFTCSF